MRRVDFFIIGAMKAGTTFLDRELSKHPDISMAKVKDKHFWSYLVYGSPRWGMKNIDNYFGSFDFDKILVGESSVWYMNFDRRLIDVMNGMFPKCKFIISIRNPIDRFMSHYNLQKYNNKIETNDISRVLELNKHGRKSIVRISVVNILIWVIIINI